MDDKSPPVIAVVVVFFVLSWIAIGLRVFTRIRVTKSFGSDDTAIVVLQMCFTTYLVSQLQAWRYGLGKYDIQLSPEEKSNALLWWWVGFLLYIICVCLFKLSVGFFLLRIAVDTIHIWILRTFTFGTIVCGIVFFILVIFQCQPPAAYWRESPRAPECWNDTTILAMDIWASLMNCIADWTFVIVPIFVVRSLNMSKRTKRSMMGLLSFAAIGSIATVVRMFYLPKLLQGDDFLYTSMEVAILSTIESGIGITAVSLMTLQPLWEYWHGRVVSSTPYSNVSLSRRTLGKRQRSEYIKTNESDGNPPLNLRPDNVMSISEASGPTSSNRSSARVSGGLPEQIPMADRTSATGITRTMEVIQSRLNADQINGLLPSTPQMVPAEALCARGFTASQDTNRMRRRHSTDQDDDASLQFRTLRLSFLSSFPSLLSLFNGSKRKSADSSHQPASTRPPSPSALQPNSFDVPRTTGTQEENHSQVHPHQP